MPGVFHRRVIGWVPFLVVLVSAGVLGAIRDNRIVTDVSWTRSFAGASRRARRSAKPMLIAFSLTGCAWCEKMDAETFSDPRVVEESRSFVCANLDGEMDRATAKRYGVTEFPTTIVADSSGRPLARLTGFVSPANLASLLKSEIK